VLLHDNEDMRLKMRSARIWVQNPVEAAGTMKMRKTKRQVSHIFTAPWNLGKLSAGEARLRVSHSSHRAYPGRAASQAENQRQKASTASIQ